MIKIHIKATHDQNNQQYWFAESETDQIFASDLPHGDRFIIKRKEAEHWSKFYSLEDLKNELNRHFDKLKKSTQDPELVETLEF